VELFGRIISALDNYSFTAGSAFNFELIGGGIDNEAGQAPNNLIFTFTNQTTMEVFTYNLDTNSPLGTIATLTAGAYLLEINMDPDNGTARYDIGLQAVPVPAALPLFAAGLAGFTAMRRRRQKA
jgi:hypothetical protein